MTHTSTRPRLKVIFTVAMLLMLGPMWIWNERVAHLPVDVSMQLMPGQLIVGRDPIHNWEQSWFDGSSSQLKLFSRTVMTIDVRTGQWTVGQQPLVVVQNEQRFTFEEVPSMNGYLVRIEDLKGVKPTRQVKVNVQGRPILVNARYLVWSRTGFFEVVDLSVDEDRLTVLESENLGSRYGPSLKPIPGSNSFFDFSNWTRHGQLSLFKIEEGRVVSLGEWVTVDREVGLSGGEILTHSADGTIQIHAVDDGRLVSELPNPFDLLTNGRLSGRLLIERGSNACFDLITQRKISVPFKFYQPQAMNDSVAIFLSLPHVHPSHVWAYDFEKGGERFHVVLPSTVVQAQIEGNRLIAAGNAHAITVYTIDLATGKILHTLEPYRLTSRSAGLLALCMALWCVAWIWLQPVGRVWIELALVLAVLLLGLKPYQAYSQTMVILLVTSGFAWWHACLSPGEFINGITRTLLICGVGLTFLPDAAWRSRCLLLLGIWWLLVLLLQVGLPRWLGFRLVNQRNINNGAARMSILHLMSLMTIAAVLVVGWRDMDWTWTFSGPDINFMVIIAINGCLLGLTSWLGLWRRRRCSYGWLSAMLPVLLLGLVVLPRLFLLWYGHSIFDGLDGQAWSTWSDFLSQDSSHPLEILWETATICLTGPYLLAVALRYGGTVLQKPSKSAPALGNSGQVSQSPCE